MDRYLAIPQGRCRRSSGSPQTPYIPHRFYRVWGCRGPAGSHSFHLVAEKGQHQCVLGDTENRLQALDFNNNYQRNKMDNKHLCVSKAMHVKDVISKSHFLIHFHDDFAKQEGPSCFLLLCDLRQETEQEVGIGLGAGSSTPASISHCGMLFQNPHGSHTHAHTLCYPKQSRRADRST